MQPANSVAADPMLGFMLSVLNQVFEIEKKLAALPAGSTSIPRNINRLKSLFEQDVPAASAHGKAATLSLTYHNPLGEKYDETRTDCEAAGIAGSSAEGLVITEVIKPIVWLSAPGQPKTIIQRAVIVAEAKPASAIAPGTN